MIKRCIVICLIGLLACSVLPLSAFFDSSRKPSHKWPVRAGVMDLSTWEAGRGEVVKLDGEWEFYWNRLLGPEDFNRERAANALSPTWIKVPSEWNGKFVDGGYLPAYGSATYRMKIVNLSYDGMLALKKTNVRSSAHIYVNGHKLLQSGIPSLRQTDYKPGNEPQLGLFPSGTDELEILVQVSNYDYINGGIPVSLYLGTEEAMSGYQQKNTAREFAVLAMLGTLALIYFICFVTAARHGNYDYSLLAFSALCLFYGVYNGLIGERSLLLLFPSMPYGVYFRIKDLLSLSAVIVLAIALYQLRMNIISYRLVKGITGLLGTFLVLIVLLPIPLYVSVLSYVVALYELLLIWLLCRVGFIYITSAAGSRRKPLLLFVALLCINLYSVDVILFSLSYKANIWSGQLYISAFNFFLIFLVVQRFFEAYRELRDMKNRLVEMDRIKDDFLSNTSHELRTPLNAIVNITDSLLKGGQGPLADGQAGSLAIVMGSGRKLTHLVNELLDYSKLKHGDIPLHRNSLNLKPIVDSVIGVHRFLLGGKRLDIVNDLSEGLPPVYADGNRLTQILHNLIGNAIKFTDAGAVRIGARVAGDKMEVCVEDTGVGIPPHMRERIFMAFEQDTAWSNRNVEGTGLGLSITKRLVMLHGGDISVESSPWRGSVFKFSLPLSVQPGKGSGGGQRKGGRKPEYGDISTPSFEYPVHIPGNKEWSILVVDDDYANLQSIIHLLRLESYPITVVNRGRMALEQIALNPRLYLVILDIMMPDMSGYEVLGKIRERLSPVELPVLMLTARTRPADTRRSMEKGANDFVGKPFEAEELMARVSSLIKLKVSVNQAKEAEMAFLRSQIKPHFLYNALNSIASLCGDDPDKAEELTIYLSQYLRSSFDFKDLNSLTTIENELKLVQAYVLIEQARFGDRLRVEYDVEPELSACIPPLMLQPLVENAIRHGLMTSIQGGTIVLSVRRETEHMLYCGIQDDGCGMDDATVRRLLRPDAESGGIGLWNINKRLRLIYGTELQIESEPNRGTKVSFRLPV